MGASVNTIYDMLTHIADNLTAVNEAANKIEAHRELIFEVKPGEYTSFLKLKDEQHTWYNIPLGKTRSRPESGRNKHENILVPVVPLNYTTPDCDPKLARSPRQGYIYIYREDYLWRELEVLERGFFRDVNLRMYQGKDRRPATTERDSRILLPFRIGGKTEKLSMCFSEIQWSWARINSMGGMDPADFRINPETPPAFAADMGTSKKQAEDNRFYRMQEIDLTGYDKGFPNTPPAGNKARIDNSNSSNLLYKKIHMLHGKSELPKVYLHDPMGIAIRNIQEYYQYQLELMYEIEKAQMHEHYKSAVIAYHAFYNEELWAKAKRQRRQRGPAGYSKNSDTDQLLRDCAGQMSRETISEEVLAVSKRKKIRLKMRQAKNEHVEFLDAKYKGRSLFDNNPDFVHIIPALMDYAELPAPFYPALWSAARAIIHFLNVDPCSFDASLNLKCDVDAEKVKPQDDLGVKYMESLLKPDDHYKEKLYKALFPSKAQIDEFKEEFKFDGRPAEAPDGKGEYRPAALAASINNYKNPPRETMKNIEDTLKEADKIIADFIYCFTLQWERALKGITKIDVNVLFRLAKGTNIPEIRGAVLVNPNEDIGDRVILSGDVTIYEKLKRSQRREMMKASVKGKKSDFVKIVEPGTDKVIMTTEIAQLPNFKGVPLDITHEKWMDVFRKIDTNGTVSALVKLVVVPNDNPYAIKWHINEAKVPTDVKVKVALLKAGDKGLPPLLAVFEAWTLISATTELTKSGFKGKTIATALISLAGLSFAVVDVTARLAGERAAENLVAKIPVAKNYVRYMYREPIKYLGTGLKGMGMAGSAVAGLGVILASWDAVDSFVQDDDDAATAYVFQAVATLGVALAGLGQAGVMIFAGLGPFGWAFLAAAILAGIIAYLLTDTPLEKWAKHGPFASDMTDRITGEYKNYEPDRLLESLMSLLMRPSIDAKSDPSNFLISNGYKHNDMIVDVIVPGFKVGQSSLDTRATIQAGTSNARGQALRWQGQEEIFPYKIEPIYQDPSTQTNQIGYKYYYQTEGAKHVKFRARSRHITEDKLVIPTLPAEDPNTGDPVEIDPEVPGWVYIEKSVVEKRV